ncbi:MAG: cyclopropane-fatty-acyl-phospholipid synthase, partial [Verrucomicrobia bacterium]|nr:cyclopropane-fatty-acyl-phospholipid synthase [Verrucomicrobiota bacterium]
LNEWRQRFNEHHPELLKLRFDEAFIRKWNYYFSYCEAAFAQRNISVVQAVYTRPNNRSLM